MRKRYSGLIGLNVALVVALALVTIVPGAWGDQSRRGRGTYTMVPGEINGMPEAGIWIIDASNEEMMVLRWNQSSKSLSFLGYRNLRADMANARSGRRR